MKKIKIISKIVIFLIFVVISFVTTSAKSNDVKKKLNFIMIPKGVNPYYEPCFDGFKDASYKYNINAEMLSPPKFELAMQIQVIEDCIEQKVDGIAISALHDTGLMMAIDEAVKAGIKVITFDAPAPSTKASCYIGTDNYKAGYEAGKKIALYLKNQSGDIVILQGGIDAANLKLRTNGFKQAILDLAPGLKVAGIEDTKSDYALAINKTEYILKSYPQLKAIIGVSAYEAPAAALVLKDQKRSDIIIAGFDDLQDTLNGIREGFIQFTIVQSTYKMGWQSVELLLNLVNDKPIQKIIDTGIIIVDKSNVNSYLDEMKKELNK
jgi:ribose transport system substrate-binding protein